MSQILQKNHIEQQGIFKKFWAFLSPQDRKISLLLLLMMAVGAGLEVAGISLIVPFIQLLNDPEILSQNAKLARLYQLTGAQTPRQFFMFVGVGLLGFYLLKNLYLIASIHAQNRFLARKRVELLHETLRFYLKSPYTFHLQRNSAELLRNVSSVSKLVDNVWLPIMTALTELMVSIVLLAFLVVVEPVVTMVAIFFIGGATVVFYRLTRKKIGRWANAQFYHIGQMSKWGYQALTGIKELKVTASEDYFLNAYTGHYRQYSDLARKSNTLSQAPRLFSETLLVWGIVSFVLIYLASSRSVSSIIPTLVLFAMAAVRLMPSTNRLLLSAMQIREGSTYVDLVFKNFREAQDAQEEISSQGRLNGVSHEFTGRLTLKNITHQYPGTASPALKKISVEIQKGQSVAFVGPSGAGKSTIIDILLGLLPPTQGEVLIDDRSLGENISSWQKKVGYIPQQIFLSDDTIRRNIAFGIVDEEINDEQVWSALKTAQLDDFVKSLPNGLDASVGERGVRLSGGQRQRIGIARALYHNPEVLILDEATSALDNETQSEITRAIENLAGKKTLIIISHRLSMVSKCDKIYFLRNGSLVGSGTHKELLEGNKDFSQFANI
jgi:ATP-binding cassette, subfamily B, bacterial PglK